MAFNHKKYINDYKKTHYRRFNLLIPNKEKKVIKKLESQENKTKYLIDLIKKDIKEWEKRVKRFPTKANARLTQCNRDFI